MRDLLRNRAYIQRQLEIDGHEYHVWTKNWIPSPPEVPRLIVVSYLPDPRTIDLLRICLRSIKKNTASNYELWVIDNNSPPENVEWLLNEGGVRLAFNRTPPALNNGSYANAVALEIGASLIDPTSHYLMTLHQDTAAVKPTWLSYLLSKLSDTTRAVGVRLDTSRVKEGVLHVLGYLIDFQLFRELGLDFFPDLPAFDVGDQAIIAIRRAGYDIFATPNSLWFPELMQRLPPDSPFHKLEADRSFDERGQVMFLHLGRGVINTSGQATHKSSLWTRFAQEHLCLDLSSPPAPRSLETSLYRDIHYSRRRYYVDAFLTQHAGCLTRHGRIVDFGGKRKNKRGCFRAEQFGLDVTYLNTDLTSQPDICADASAVPLPDNTADGVLLSETLEHVFDPYTVLQEAQRILRPGGILLLTSPFMFHMHGDPGDYGRYTDSYYCRVLETLGFRLFIIERQGAFFGVIASLAKIFQTWLVDRSIRIARWRWIIEVVQRTGFILDARLITKSQSGMATKLLINHTTGFGIVAIKYNDSPPPPA